MLLGRERKRECVFLGREITRDNDFFKQREKERENVFLDRERTRESVCF